MIATIVLKNPRAIEGSVNLAAMYIHFQKQSKFIIDVTNKEIERIESYGEERYNQLMIQESNNDNADEKSEPTYIPQDFEYPSENSVQP